MNIAEHAILVASSTPSLHHLFDRPELLNYRGSSAGCETPWRAPLLEPRYDGAGARDMNYFVFFRNAACS